MRVMHCSMTGKPLMLDWFLFAGRSIRTSKKKRRTLTQDLFIRSLLRQITFSPKPSYTTCVVHRKPCAQNSFNKHIFHQRLWCQRKMFQMPSWETFLLRQLLLEQTPLTWIFFKQKTFTREQNTLETFTPNTFTQKKSFVPVTLCQSSFLKRCVRYPSPPVSKQEPFAVLLQHTCYALKTMCGKCTLATKKQKQKRVGDCAKNWRCHMLPAKLQHRLERTAPKRNLSWHCPVDIEPVWHSQESWRNSGPTPLTKCSLAALALKSKLSEQLTH